MKYQVVVKSEEEAVVQTTYLGREFSYVFLTISSVPEEGKSKKKDHLTKFTFASSALLPPYDRTDTTRFKVIRQNYHGEDALNVVIEALNLQEACDKFATPYNDVFEIISQHQLENTTSRRF